MRPFMILSSLERLTWLPEESGIQISPGVIMNINTWLHFSKSLGHLQVCLESTRLNIQVHGCYSSSESSEFREKCRVYI